MCHRLVRTNILKFIICSMAFFCFGVFSQAKTFAQKKQLPGSLKSAKAKTEEAKLRTEMTAGYHFSMAQAYSADGETERAIEEYKITLMYDPNSPMLHTRLAAELVKKGMLSAAMESTKEALRIDPKYTEARMLLAGLYTISHQSEAAIREYDQVLRFSPDYEEAAIYKAQALSDDQKIKEAVEVLRKYSKTHPTSAVIWYYIGRTEQLLEHTDKAVQAYEKAIHLREGFTQAALALGFLYEEKGKNKEAIGVYQSIFDSSQDVTAANRLANLFLREEKYEKSVSYLQFLEASDPDDMGVRVKLGLVQMELKNYREAIIEFKNILVKHPESDRIHFYLGSIYEETKRPELAIQELRMISPESKLFHDASLHVAYLLKQQGKLQEAKGYLAEVLGKKTKSPSIYLFLAGLEDEVRDPSKAIRTLTQAISEFPEDEKIRYYLGSLYDRQGDTAKSLEQMEVILKINPKNVDALNYIGYTWTQQGIRLNDAEKLLLKALSLRPNNGYIQDSWGWYLFIRGRVKEAVVELEKAVKLKPNEPTIMEHLGDAYLRSNLREKAISQYKDAVRYAEDDAMKKKLQLKVENIHKDLVEVPARVLRSSANEQRNPAAH